MNGRLNRENMKIDLELISNLGPKRKKKHLDPVTIVA